MKTISDSNRSQFLEQVLTYVKNKLPANQFTLLSEFVNYYYANIAIEDLMSHTVEDLAGGLLSHWQLMQKRQPQELKLRVYNPDYALDGWQSTHTIVECVGVDSPFMVDSMCMEVNRLGYSVHLIINIGGVKILRDANGEIKEIGAYDSQTKNAMPEASIYFEIDRQTDAETLDNIKDELIRVLKDVNVAVTDWQKMRTEAQQAIKEIEHIKAKLDADEITESVEFMHWLLNNNFIFLGCRNYEIIGVNKDKALKIIPGSGLGVLRDDNTGSISRYYSELPEEARKLALSKQIIITSKTNTLSTVHRHTYTDYVGVKRFNAEGEVIGERRFIGLYASAARDLKEIPILRKKIVEVMKAANLPRAGHNAKALLNILETLPSEYLFELSIQELFDISMSILQLQGRKRTKLIVYEDVYKRYISCLLYIPRDNFNTDILYKIQDVLKNTFHGKELSFTTEFTESILARIHYVIRIDAKKLPKYDPIQIEKEVIAIARSWKDELLQELTTYWGEEKGNTIFTHYARSFPSGYKESFQPRAAVYDIEHMQKLSAERVLEMSFYRPLGADENVICLKLFRLGSTIPLSDALPMLENMGLRVISEQPYQITLADGNTIWIIDFHMIHVGGGVLNVEEIRDIFQDAFYNIWCGAAENDGFNRLILAAQLTWREISVLRAYAKFLRQADFTFSQPYIEQILITNAHITRFIAQLFELRFNPALQNKDTKQRIEQIENIVFNALDKVTSLDDDRMLRCYVNLINATLRTNFYQKTLESKPKTYLSLKLNSQKIPELPLPRPAFEIFVYSPQFEGVHLRTSKVARGGIRWSDRREDFRAEILGLVKAQQVKNAIIVPSGAKGGFVIKQLPADATREIVLETAINCYKNFIRGLLDITDNIINNQLVPPELIVRHDEDDPYLVVAADKGTATFSDTANSIAAEYNFWLGDAFASGGSAGYDHKKMGITARGAWVSVTRHFQELGVNIQKTDFTVVGIGDMSGDVFGNGMLLSEHIKLVGAFNHMHIFLDPNPDSKISFVERKRLFDLPRSTWADYNEKLISTGGGVFSRSAKSIKLTPEIKTILNIDADMLAPNELIRAMLLAPVDLLWNGGIGTYVKANTENNHDAADRTNDAVRVNGGQLRCKVVGEGGNLGFTQLGRIEFALNGGMINTDFIDNSAGVDCSDHEVNIKILLNGVVAEGKMTEKQRNILLAEMTDEVGKLVLRDNYQQVRAISLATYQSLIYLNLYSRYLHEQEVQGKINRSLEYLPDEKTFLERQANGKGLTRPEIAILIAYSKIILKQKILDSDLPEDPSLRQYLETEFPQNLNEKYSSVMETHRLRRELIATHLSNTVVNDMGITFIYQMEDETSASIPVIVRAYCVAREIFQMSTLWREIESLDNSVVATTQADMMLDLIRLIRRVTRWLLRHPRRHADIASRIDFFAKHIITLFNHLPKLLVGAQAEQYEIKQKQLISANVPKQIATRIAAIPAMFSALNIIETANTHSGEIEYVAAVYFVLAEKIGLTWLREYINSYPIDTRWSVLARSAAKADLDLQQSILTADVLLQSKESKNTSFDNLIDNWIEKRKIQIHRWQSILAEIRNSTTIDFTMLAVAIRELADLVQANHEPQGD